MVKSHGCTLKVFLAITVDPINIKSVKSILFVQNLGLDDLRAMIVLTKSACKVPSIRGGVSYGTEGLYISMG